MWLALLAMVVVFGLGILLDVSVPSAPTLVSRVRAIGFARDLRSIDGRATAYVCRNYICAMPTTDPDKMIRLVQAAPD